MAATPRIPTDEISVLKKKENQIKKTASERLRRYILYLNP
jgi:hypothetical protein